MVHFTDRPTHRAFWPLTDRGVLTDRAVRLLLLFWPKMYVFHRVFHRVLQNSAHRAGQNDRTECYLHPPTEYKFTHRVWQRLTDRAQFVISSVGTIPCSLVGRGPMPTHVSFRNSRVYAGVQRSELAESHVNTLFFSFNS